MIGNKLPQNLLSGLALGAGVGAIMLALFYGQYHWLANELVSSSAAQHNIVLRASFERRMRAQLHGMADRVAVEIETDDAGRLSLILDRMVAENAALSGLRVEVDDHTSLQSGNFPQSTSAEETTWLTDSLSLSYPILQTEDQIGELHGAFLLDDLHAESAAFATDLANKETLSRRASYVWIGLGTFATFISYLLVVGAIARRQSIRVRALKEQAEKFRDADLANRWLKPATTSLVSWHRSLMTCAIDCVTPQSHETMSIAFYPA